MKLAVRLVAILVVFTMVVCAAELWTRHYEEENRVILTMCYLAGKEDVVDTLESNLIVRAITYIKWKVNGRFDGNLTFTMGEMIRGLQ